jgi:hypothetical protein
MYTIDEHNNTFRVRLRVGHLRSRVRHDILLTLRSVFWTSCPPGVDEDRDADAVLVIRDCRKAPLSDLSSMPETVRRQHIPTRSVLGPFDTAPPATVRTMTDRQQRNFRVAFHMDDMLWRVTPQASLRCRILRKLTSLLATFRGQDRSRSALLANGDTGFVQGYQQPVGSVGYVGHPGFPWAVTGGRPADRHRRNDSRRRSGSSRSTRRRRSLALWVSHAPSTPSHAWEDES